MRAKEINPNDMTPNKQHSKTESTSLETPHFAYTSPLGNTPPKFSHLKLRSVERLNAERIRK